MTTVNSSVVITDKGREMISRFLVNSIDWSSNGYKLFDASKWGEGGWVEENGSKQPKDSSDFRGNTDLEIVLNPGDYPGSDYASNLISIDQSNELVYESGMSDIIRVRSILATSEENDKDSGTAGNQNPTFWEVGVFDNAASNLPSFNEDHMILYGIFGVGIDKTNSIELEANHRIPF